MATGFRCRSPRQRGRGSRGVFQGPGRRVPSRSVGSKRRLFSRHRRIPKRSSSQQSLFTPQLFQPPLLSRPRPCIDLFRIQQSSQFLLEALDDRSAPRLVDPILALQRILHHIEELVLLGDVIHVLVASVAQHIGRMARAHRVVLAEIVRSLSSVRASSQSEAPGKFSSSSTGRTPAASSTGGKQSTRVRGVGALIRDLPPSAGRAVLHPRAGRRRPRRAPGALRSFCRRFPPPCWCVPGCRSWWGSG